MSLRINPNVARLVCSLSGAEVSHGGFARPIACARAAAARQAGGRRVRPRRGPPPAARTAASAAECGLWTWGPLLPVLEPPRDLPTTSAVCRSPVTTASRAVRRRAVPRARGRQPVGQLQGPRPRGRRRPRLRVGRAALRPADPGQAGVAASLFSARLGLPGCLVWMPEAWRDSIYHRACAHFGAEVRFAGPNIATAGRVMRETLTAELARASRRPVDVLRARTPRGQEDDGPRDRRVLRR